MNITNAKLHDGFVIINQSLALPDNSTGHVRDSFNEWLAQGNTPEPEFTQAELVVAAAAEKVEQARSYLLGTDALAIRKADTGQSIPDEIEARRAKARIVLLSTVEPSFDLFDV
jgi:hypothetical protein